MSEFVTSEQRLDASSSASIQPAATKVTNIDSFIPKRRLLTNGKPEFEKKFHLVVDKLRFLGYYKTVMIIITSCK